MTDPPVPPVTHVPSLFNRKDRAHTEAAVEKWMGIVGLDAGLRERYPDELLTHPATDFVARLVARERHA